MCCDPPAADRLPPPVAAMLAGYRALAAERPADWGGESDAYAQAQPYARWLGSRLLAASAAFGNEADGATRMIPPQPLLLFCAR